MTIAALLVLALVAVGSAPRGPHPGAAPGDRIAQFGAMTKQRATPVPQRTAAPGTRQNVERRGAPPQGGAPFGGIRK